MIRLDSSLTKIFDITDGSVHCEQVSSSLTEHIQILSSSNLEDLKDEAQRVRDLFFKTLPQYDYDRSAIALRSPFEAI